MLSRAWELLAAGNPLKALDIYDLLTKNLDDLPNHQQRGILFINRAHALAALGRFADATDSALTADFFTSERGNTGMRYLLEASKLCWLAGDPYRALELALRDMDSIEFGKTHFTDFGGGSSNALNLLYISHKLDAEAEMKRAIDFMRMRSSARAGRGWPRPVLLHVLGELSYADLLQSASGATNLDAALLNSQTDVLTKRQLPVALFYAALKNDLNGDVSQKVAHWKACCSIAAAVPALEWYMAKAELANNEVHIVPRL